MLFENPKIGHAKVFNPVVRFRFARRPDNCPRKSAVSGCLHLLVNQAAGFFKVA
jgi:hypothetical protein